VWVTAAALQILLNDKYKLESLQGDVNRTVIKYIDSSCIRSVSCNNLCCGVGVGIARSRSFLGGVEFLRTLEVGVCVGVGSFYLTPEVQLNHILHRISKLGSLTRAC